MDSSRKETFVNLVYDNISIIYKICRVYSSVDNEDLKQEIVYQLWKAFPSFKGKSKFQTWMYRVALNTAIVGFRKKQINTIPLSPELDNDMAEEKDTSESQIALLYKHIGKLDDVEKAVIFLYLEKCSYEEIGKVLGLRPGNVGVKLNCIKKKLRVLFEDKTD